MCTEPSFDIIDLESSNYTLEEKFQMTHKILGCSMKINVPQIQEVFLWFLNRKEELMRKNTKFSELDLLYENLLKCLETHQISVLSVHQLKFNIVDNLFQILNVKENSISIEFLIQCCLSVLKNDNLVKCLEQDLVLFLKFSTCTNALFTQETDNIQEKLIILIKLVSIMKKIKWNSDLSVHEMTRALVCVATLDHWNSWHDTRNGSLQQHQTDLWEDYSAQKIHGTLEQVFYSVVTKDGSQCGILLTSFRDETILTEPAYAHIFNLISALELIPVQHEGHITGIIYSFLLSTTYKLSEDYYGEVSFVFEKLDLFIRKEISKYAVQRLQEVTPIPQIEPLDHWTKMIVIYTYMTEFLVKNNISSGLPLVKQNVPLEDLCSRISKCIMYVVCRLHLSENDKVKDPNVQTSELIDKCYSVLLSFFKFDPYIAVFTFPFFKRFVIYTKNRHEHTMYGNVFAAILTIHFKLSKEVLFLKSLLCSEDITSEDIMYNACCWLPVNQYKTALHQIFSSVSPERILSGWFSCLVSKFNMTDLNLISCIHFHIYLACTTLVCTLEVTLLMKKSLGDSSVVNKQMQYLDDIKKSMGGLKSILILMKTRSTPQIYYETASHHMLLFSANNATRVLVCFLEVALHWGIFHMMSSEYNGIEVVEKNIKLLRPDDHAMYLLHDYLDLQDWRELESMVRTKHKHCKNVKNAFCELLVQSLDMLESYVTTNRKLSPQEGTSKYLVDNSDKAWLIRCAHLVHPYLNINDQWKLAKKLSKHLLSQEPPQDVLSSYENLYERNVLVFQIAFCILKQALIHAYDSGDGTDIGEAVVLLECQQKEINALAINEDKQSFLKKLLKSTENPNVDDSDNERNESDSEDEKTKMISDEEVDIEMKCSLEDENDTSETKAWKKTKMDGVINNVLITFLAETKSIDLPRSDLSKYISIIEQLPVQYLEKSSQHLLFILVIVCARVSSSGIASLIDSFVLGKDFSIPHSDIIPFVLEILQNTETTITGNSVVQKICKLCVQSEDAIQVTSEFCELTKKKVDDIKVDVLRSQSQVTYNVLSELSCKGSNKSLVPLKNKLVRRALRNYKSLKIEPSQEFLLLFTFMLRKSLKEHDSTSIQVLTKNLNAYLHIALKYKHAELIETVLTYSALSLKNHIPTGFTPKVWKKLPSCAHLCFLAASLEQFNQFLDEMFTQLNDVLERANTNPCDLAALDMNFLLWRKLLSSHWSKNKFSSRLAKLEAVITSVSIHVSLYTGNNTQHFPVILDLIVDIVNSQAFVICGNTSSVHSLFNLLTPKSCVYFKPCMKLLHYLITKKSSIITNETALFLLKYHALLTQITKHVCHSETTSTERDVLLLAIGKIAHAIRKEKKHFQRVVPYTLSNMMHLYVSNKFPLDVTVHMNEICNTFISICDEHGINFLKHSLPDSSKQIFLQTLQIYTKHHSQRFV